MSEVSSMHSLLHVVNDNLMPGIYMGNFNAICGDSDKGCGADGVKFQKLHIPELYWSCQFGDNSISRPIYDLQ